MPEETEAGEGVVVIRIGTSIQPVSVPYIGYHRPRARVAQAEQIALVLALVSLGVCGLLRFYVVAAILAVLAALCTVIARPWASEETTPRQVSRTLAVALVVLAAVVASMTLTALEYFHESQVSHRTSIDPERELYGLAGTQTPTIFDFSGGDCTVDANGFAHASGVVTNLVKRTKSFEVSVTFRSGNGQVLATGTDRLDAVPSNAAVAFDVSASVGRNDVECRVTAVEVVG